ncbi:MAG: NAD(P)-binding protein [Candidatus Lokiarchaeota archaeon]|nr:NAD(P)-binding protein [Candidatus Lokiarchaeota archaeon]
MILEPLKITNTLEVANRAYMPAMHLSYADYKGAITDKFIRFYEERAKGGTGMVVIGGCNFTETSAGAPTMPNLGSDEFLPGLKKFAETIHQYDTKCAAQLYHSGRYGVFGDIVAPSESDAPFLKSTARELKFEEIEKIIVDYGAAAARLKEAGFDAVQVCGNTGYLPGQFISPLINKRTDKYGGRTLEERYTFLDEVIKSIRNQTGNFPLIWRMPHDDLVPGSLSYKDWAKVAPMLERSGADLLDIAGAWHTSKVPQLTSNVPWAAFSFMAYEIKKAVKIPTVECHRIHDLDVAEELLINNYCDLIGWGRPLICDPYIIRKIKENREDDIRWCIGCAQGCFDMVFEAQPITCLQNPQAGKEDRYEITPTKEKKKILIIGGGPGGMEAARVAKMRGHDVILYEKTDHLGGAFYLAAVPPSRNEFMRAIDWLKHQLEKLGVEIVMNTECTMEIVEQIDPDHIIVAEGGEDIIPKISGINLDHVSKASDVLLGKVHLKDNIVIIGGGATGVEVALYASKKGSITPEVAMFMIEHRALDIEEAMKYYRRGLKNITVIDILPKLGKNIGRSTRWTMLKDLRYKGINELKNTEVIEIKKDEVIVKHNDEIQNIKADNVVIATGIKKNRAFHKTLKKKGYDAKIIGDAKRPKKAIDAIEAGFKAGLRA